MGKGKNIVETILGVTEGLISSENVQKFLCGTYSDGTPRSLPDALNDELYSPQQKKNKNNKKGKKKKSKKKIKKKNIDKIFIDL